MGDVSGLESHVKEKRKTFTGEELDDGVGCIKLMGIRSLPEGSAKELFASFVEMWSGALGGKDSDAFSVKWWSTKSVINGLLFPVESLMSMLLGKFQHSWWVGQMKLRVPIVSYSVAFFNFLSKLANEVNR